MMNPALRPDASLPEYLAARARAASDGRLVADAIVGCCAALGVAVWRPAGWLVLLGASVCLAAFGAWGIADRELRERGDAPRARVVRVLSAVRFAAAAVGALSAVAAIFAALGIALGTWIS
ncbi:MAG: hypothetical protein JF589_04845 [Gemmatimonadetes bacterium]|jgi:hypothetical protein|nr:hypothetical protein [Gemmatimonadota bacterium]